MAGGARLGGGIGGKRRVTHELDHLYRADGGWSEAFWRDGHNGG